MKRSIKFKLIEKMKFIRAVEEAIANRYYQNKMRCPTHLSLGQEAIAAATGIALKKNDVSVSYHRSHAHYLCRGGNLKKMLAEIYGFKEHLDKITTFTKVKKISISESIIPFSIRRFEAPI